MKILITGITGFVGSHLADYLLTKDEIDIYGILRWRSRTENIDHLKNRIKLFECDIRDLSSVRTVIEEVKPEKIFHLAAQSFVPASWSAPSETLTTNVIGELNILESARKCGNDPSIHIAGSSEEYGTTRKNELPIKETNALNPLSPYGVSKVAQDLLAYQYYQSYGLKTIRTRAFNHTGPRRGEVFICSNFAKQIAGIEKGLKKPVIYVGNLKAERDFTDVRDVVRAYWIAIERCVPGEVYNICSGKVWSMREVLDILLSFTKVKIDVEQDPKRMRPSDLPILVGDNTKFRKQTGWRPEITFEKTLQDTLNYWRKRVCVREEEKIEASGYY